MELRSDESAKEFVTQTVREQGVKFIRLWFTDILGNLKGFAISPAQLEEALETGIGFDGSAIEGFARTDESDMVAVPDPSTFAILPWRPKESGVARIFADIKTPEQEYFDGDPRQVLKRNLNVAAESGYTFYVGPELEYFYFKNSQDPTPLDTGGYFDQMPMDFASDLRRETILTLEDVGIQAEYSHHEVAPSQDEIVLRYEDALTMADNCMTYQLVVKEVARRHNVHATFMPKPLVNVNGSGMHTHQSLFIGDTNCFYDSDKPDNFLRFHSKYIKKYKKKINIPIFHGILMVNQNSLHYDNISKSLTQDYTQKDSDGIEKTVSIIETFLKNGINSFYLIPPIYKKGERDYKLANSVIAKIKNN